MVKIVTRRLVEKEELEQLASSIKSIFKLRSDEEFAERIALKIAEMVKNGQKVYVTSRAAKVLEPILEKYGIVLVPARRIEYPHILVDVYGENVAFIRFKTSAYREPLEREVNLQIFIKHLEEALESVLKKRKGKKQVFIYQPSL